MITTGFKTGAPTNSALGKDEALYIKTLKIITALSLLPTTKR